VDQLNRLSETLTFLINENQIKNPFLSLGYSYVGIKLLVKVILHLSRTSSLKGSTDMQQRIIDI